MRAIVFILLSSCSCLLTTAQRTQNKIDSYKLPLGDLSNTVVIEMPYASADVLKITGDTIGLKNADQLIIEIVCTDYPSASSLNTLNQNRLSVFYSLFPFVDPKKLKDVQVTRQTDGAIREKALALFHGVVVHFRPRQTEETMRHDLTMLEKILGPGLFPGRKRTSSTVIHSPRDAITVRTVQNFYVCQVSAGKVSSSLDYDSLVHIKPIEALEKGYITSDSYYGRVKKENGSTTIQQGLKDENFITVFFCRITETSTMFIDSASISKQASSTAPLPDSTILKIFKRNQWKNFALTGDVTGSMYPYTAQMLLWLKLQSLDGLTTRFSFFNDGDNKPDREKKIGSTGGIYSKTCTSFTEVLELVKSTMQKGGGGDISENDIEALIATEKQFPDIDFHVLIADNWATLKDQELLKQLKKPVRVVLCGVYNNYINVDYLNLARNTGGSVHLLETDLVNLAALHEGEVLSIGNKKYRIVNGLFKEVNPPVENGL